LTFKVLPNNNWKKTIINERLLIKIKDDMFSVLLSPESWGEVNGVFAQSVEWVHKDIEKKVCGNFRDHPILVRRGFSAVPCSIDNTVSDR
jgi:hypothetical protein